jgi:hypothetical protein
MQDICRAIYTVYGIREVCVKMQTMQGAACPRFHVDRVVVRALCTYHGPGTEYVPPEDTVVLGNRVIRVAEDKVQRCNAGDILFLKGLEDSWCRPPAVHRSPLSSEPRLLLIADTALDSLPYFLSG